MSRTQSIESPSARVFVAASVEATPELTKVLSRLREMRRGLRVVRDDQLHITLKFYGDVAEEFVPRLAAGLDRLVERHRPFSWTVRGTGVFPNPSRPHVVWAGVDDDGRFTRIADEIERFSESLGFVRESRPFAPHLTLARVKFRPPATLSNLLCETDESPFGPQRTDSLTLMKSQLTAGGSIYSVLHVASFSED